MNQGANAKRMGQASKRVRIGRTLLALGLLAICATGCVSTEQYSRFAEAGTAYANALERLLVAAGNTAIDATSEDLLQDDQVSNRTLEDYNAVSAKNEKRLEIIGRLRAHARLLARYFGLLNELATSDAPSRAQQGVKAVADGLNGIGSQIRRSDLVENVDVFTTITRLVVGSTIRGLLRYELEQRSDIIWRELKTQEELLKALTKDMQHNLAQIKELREQRLVIDLLIADQPVAGADRWVAHRRTILTSRATAEELKIATGAAKELRQAFEDLVAGRLSLQRLNNLLADLESMLAVAEAVNR